MSENAFPPGTPVCVRQTITRSGKSIETEVVGTVESWEDRPTGSWFTHGETGKLHLKRLMLRKVDGEVSLLNIDDGTTIAKLETTAPGDAG